MWTVDEENELIARNLRSLEALAAQQGGSIDAHTARSIAFGQALATLHLREANRAIAEIAKDLRHTPRPEVARFAEAMEAKLRKKDGEYGRRGWEFMAPEAFRETLDDHIQKLWKRWAAGQGPDQLLSDAADVANLAMIVALTGRADRRT